MRKSIFIAAILSQFTAPVEAGTLTVDALTAEDSCNCACLTRFWYKETPADPQKLHPAILEFHSGKAYLRLNAEPITLDLHVRQDKVWTKYEGQSSRTHLQVKTRQALHESEPPFIAHLSGTIRVTHDRQTRTMKVTGYSVC